MFKTSWAGEMNKNRIKVRYIYISSVNIIVLTSEQISKKTAEIFKSQTETDLDLFSSTRCTRKFLKPGSEVEKATENVQSRA